MAKLIDMTGKRIGRLTVVSRAENNNQGQARWNCACDCGGESTITGGGLRGKKPTQSCGCLTGEVASKRYLVDMTGKKYGMLTGIRRVGSSNGKATWLFECDCGNETVKSGKNVRVGMTRSCGCQWRSVEDLTGRVFGRLTVVRFDSLNIHGHSYWYCECECGGSTITGRNTLMSGNSKSCGCYQKQQASEANITHGMSDTKEYAVYMQRKRSLLDRYWTFEMDAALRNLQSVCVVCGSDTKLAIDHIKPMSKGHGLLPGNAVRLCRACNSQKSARDLCDLEPSFAKKVIIGGLQFYRHWQELQGREAAV